VSDWLSPFLRVGAADFVPLGTRKNRLKLVRAWIEIHKIVFHREVVMAANDVTLRLSGLEYEQLLKTVYLGDWLLTSRQPEQDKDVEKLESKIFSYASSVGLGKYADYDRETEMFFPADALHEAPEINAAISDYDDETFWEELSDRLAERELADKAAGLEGKERFAALWDAADRYEYEFEENGIENVFIVKNTILKALLHMLPGRLADRPLEDNDGDETCVCPECAAKIAAGAPAGLKTPHSHPPGKN